MKKRLFPVLLFISMGQVVFCQQNDSMALAKRTRFSADQLKIPATLIVAGIACTGGSSKSIRKQVATERNEHMNSFHTCADNYLQYAPILIVYGLDALGVKAKTDVLNRTAILIKGELMMYASVNLIKNTTRVMRPDHSTKNSFPSGHTANAFAAATFLSEEYKDRFKWMPYAAYGVASTVGLLRVANNRHYISDVLVGAGLGYLSMKASYWTHQYKWGKKKAATVAYVGF